MPALGWVDSTAGCTHPIWAPACYLLGTKSLHSKPIYDSLVLKRAVFHCSSIKTIASFTHLSASRYLQLLCTSEISSLTSFSRLKHHLPLKGRYRAAPPRRAFPQLWGLVWRVSYSARGLAWFFQPALATLRSGRKRGSRGSVGTDGCGVAACQRQLHGDGCGFGRRHPTQAGQWDYSLVRRQIFSRTAALTKGGG